MVIELKNILLELFSNKNIPSVYSDTEEERISKQKENKIKYDKTQELLVEALEIIKNLPIADLRSLNLEHEVKKTILDISFKLVHDGTDKSIVLKEIQYQSRLKSNIDSITDHKPEHHSNTSRKILLAYQLGLIASIRRNLKEEYTSIKNILNVLYDLGILDETDKRSTSETRLKEVLGIREKLNSKQLELLKKEYPKFRF